MDEVELVEEDLELEDEDVLDEEDFELEDEDVLDEEDFELDDEDVLDEDEDDSVLWDCEGVSDEEISVLDEDDSFGKDGSESDGTESEPDGTGSVLDVETDELDEEDESDDVPSEEYELSDGTVSIGRFEPPATTAITIINIATASPAAPPIIASIFLFSGFFSSGAFSGSITVSASDCLL